MCCVKTRAEPGPGRGCELVAHPGNGSASVSTHHNVETELLRALANTRRLSGASPHQQKWEDRDAGDQMLPNP
jgi:hypothetical protein